MTDKNMGEEYPKRAAEPPITGAVYAGPEWLNNKAVAPNSNMGIPFPGPDSMNQKTMAPNPQTMMVYAGPDYFRGPAPLPPQTSYVCIKCGTENSLDADFCKKCGLKFMKPTPADENIEKVECSSCGKMVNKAYKFCEECGMPIPRD